MGGRRKHLAARQPDSRLQVSDSGQPDAPYWPAVIQYRGDDELLYLADADDWQAQLAGQHFPFSEHDRLIDSRGRVFLPADAVDGGPSLRTSGETLGLDGFTLLLRAHAVRAGNCCAGKVGCRDVGEGIRLIARMEDD